MAEGRCTRDDLKAKSSPDFPWRKREAGPSTRSLQCKDFAQDDTFFGLRYLGKYL